MIYEFTLKNTSGSSYKLHYDTQAHSLAREDGTYIKAPDRPYDGRMLIRFVLGKRCNANCAYCVQHKKQPDEIVDAGINKEKLVTAIADFVGDRGVSLIQFWGGDAFVYYKQMKEYHELFSRILPPDLGFSIPTNGLLLHGGRAEWAIENRIKIWISYDGRSQHLRGQDLLQNPEIVSNLRKLQEMYKLVFNPVITNTSYQLTEYRDAICKVLNTTDIMLGECRVVFVNDEIGWQNRVSEDELVRHSKIVTDILLHNKLPGWEFAHNNVANFINNLGTPVNDLPRCPVRSPHMLTVDVNGNILTCQNQPRIPKHVHGSAFDLSPGGQHPAPELPKQYVEMRKNKCKDCIAYNWCRGNCPFATNQKYIDYNCKAMYYQFLPFLTKALHNLTGDLFMTAKRLGD